MALSRKALIAERRRMSVLGERGALARWAREDAHAGKREAPKLTRAEAGAAAQMGLPAPSSWREACVRQRAAVVALQRERLSLQIDALKCALIPVSDVREFAARVRAVLLRDLVGVADLAARIPDGHQHQIEAMRRELEKFVATASAAIHQVRIEPAP